MVIIITGASHTGKTMLAQKLLEKYKYPYYSIDHLKMGLIRSKNTLLSVEDDDELTEYLWPIVRETIKTAIENNQNLIIEGCYIPYNWYKDFDKNYLDNIKSICLVMTNDYIKSHYDKIINHASDIEKRIDDEDCNIESLIKDNKKYMNDFNNQYNDVIIIDDDYEKSIKNIKWK